MLTRICTHIHSSTMDICNANENAGERKREKEKERDPHMVRYRYGIHDQQCCQTSIFSVKSRFYQTWTAAKMQKVYRENAHFLQQILIIFNTIFLPKKKTKFTITLGRF